MNKKTFFLVIVVLFVFSGFYLFRDNSENFLAVDYQETSKENYSQIKEILNQFLDRPYQLGPLGEKESEKLYREDVFDCTTLVLVTASNLNSPDNPEKMMKKINYYPAGEISYQNRLHFSSYRNKVSDYFEDITPKVAENYLSSKKVNLNGGQNGKLIDIDWQKEITLNYIKTENIEKIIKNLPPVSGVMFMRENYSDIGLDVGHEGFVLDNQDLVHASSVHQKVVKENFLTYLKNSNYDGVIFYKLN